MRNLYLSENQLNETNVVCRDNHNYTCHICAKEFLDSNCDSAVINKISIFMTLLHISHTYKNHNFESIF